MTRRREEEEPQQPDLAGVDESLEQFVSTFGVEGGKISFYRANPATGDDEFLGKTAYRASIDEQYIATTYGPGRYTVRLLDDRGRFKKQCQINIAAPPAPPPPPPVPAPVQTSAQIIDDPRVALLRAELERSNALLLELLRARGGGGGEKLSLRDVIELATQMGRDSTGGDSMAQFLSMFERGLTLGKDQSGSADWKAEAIRALREGLPELAQAFRGREGRSAVQQQPRTSDAAVRDGIRHLKPKALAGKDVGLWIDLIVDNAADHPELIKRFLNSSFDDVVLLDPDLSQEPYRAWFLALYEGVKSGLSGDDDTGGNGGDAEDATGNAGDGPPERGKSVDAASRFRSH